MMRLYLAAILVMILVISSCNNEDDPTDLSQVDFKREMRLLVQEISTYAKTTNPSFIIIPQNGIELITINAEPEGDIDSDYLEAIDGVGQEDLFYGYVNDNEVTPTADREYLVSYLDKLVDANKKVLVTDYCSTPLKMDDSYAQNRVKQYISIAAPSRELDIIPSYPSNPFAENAGDISALNLANNFLYLINPSGFTDVSEFIAQVTATNYDVLIIDAFFNDVALSKSQVTQLKTKANGGSRKVIAYMSIGEAEDYRYYWQTDWAVGNPSFIKEVNPNWPGNYKVAYWDKEWKSVIYGTTSSYVDLLISNGFDGTYLDIIDAFEYFENQ